MADYWTRRFWDRRAQVRNAMDQRHNDHERAALATEHVISEIISDACAPWFENARADSEGVQK